MRRTTSGGADCNAEFAAPPRPAGLGPFRNGAACLLARLVEGDRAFELRRQSLEDGHRCGRSLGGTLAGELGCQCQPRGPFVQHQNRLGAPAEHQIGLPIAELLAAQDRLGPIVNRATTADHALGFAAFAPTAAGLAARQQLPELLDLLPRPIDEGIDRLRAEPAQPGLVAGLQPPCAARATSPRSTGRPRTARASRPVRAAPAARAAPGRTLPRSSADNPPTAAGCAPARD
jgi:hypothetical protein